VGSGYSRLAEYVAAGLVRRGVEEALRLAVAAGAASILEVGAGRFEPREAARLAPAVRVDELAAVTPS
jgi:fructose-1-phosphate kinase PfkB-like protein